MEAHHVGADAQSHVDDLQGEPLHEVSERRSLQIHGLRWHACPLALCLPNSSNLRLHAGFSSGHEIFILEQFKRTPCPLSLTASLRGTWPASLPRVVSLHARRTAVHSARPIMTPTRSVQFPGRLFSPFLEPFHTLHELTRRPMRVSLSRRTKATDNPRNNKPDAVQEQDADEPDHKGKAEGL